MRNRKTHLQRIVTLCFNIYFTVALSLWFLPLFTFNFVTELWAGPAAIGVPGEVAGFLKEWKAYGKAPWADLVQPSINLARNGFTVTPILADLIMANQQAIKDNNGLRYVTISQFKRKWIRINV